MRYDYAGPSDHHPLESVLYGILGYGIQCRSRLIQNEYLRILEYDPRERQPLLLAARQLESAVSDLSVVAVRLR